MIYLGLVILLRILLELTSVTFTLSSKKKNVSYIFINLIEKL